MSFPSPALTVPTLDTWQGSFNGLTFGAGTPYRISGVEGLGGLAPILSGDAQRARDHGELVGLDVFGGDDFTITFDVYADSISLQHALTGLATATPCGLATEQPLWLQIPDWPLLAVMCRARKRSVKWDVAYQIGKLAKGVPVMWHRTDPRIYSAPSNSDIVGLPTPAGGMTFPATYPLTFGSGSGGGGTVTVTNGGNMEMRPVLVITGPVTNPTVANDSIAGSPAITIANPDETSYTVLTGDQLVIDLDLHSVTYFTGGVTSGDPGADRKSWVVYPSTTWWNLPSGANLIRFTSTDASPVGGTCEVEWADVLDL